MFIEILQNTPLYVYWMFISLLAVGFLQRKTRILSVKRALGVPILLSFLSILGFYFDFSFSLLSLTFFLIAFALLFLISLKYQKSSHIQFSKQKQIFTIEGSFIPLLMMMLVFFTKYLVGVLSALESELLSNFYFIASISFAYGLFFCSFFLRFYVLYKKLKS